MSRASRSAICHLTSCRRYAVSRARSISCSIVLLNKSADRCKVFPTRAVVAGLDDSILGQVVQRITDVIDSLNSGFQPRGYLHLPLSLKRDHTAYEETLAGFRGTAR